MGYLYPKALTLRHIHMKYSTLAQVNRAVKHGKLTAKEAADRLLDMVRTDTSSYGLQYGPMLEAAEQYEASYSEAMRQTHEPC